MPDGVTGNRAPQGPVVLAQAIYDPASNTIRMQFAPFVDDPVMAAQDVIKACAAHTQAHRLQGEERKPKILVPRIGFGL